MTLKPFALAALLLSAPALATTVDWAMKPADGPSGPSTAAVLGQPDGVATALQFYSYAFVRDFKPGKASAAAIEKALKLPPGELARWDVIAFESKTADPAAPGFDSSSWMATDLKGMSSAIYDSRTGKTVAGTGAGWSFRSGHLTNAEYKALFAPAPRAYGDYAWILIKLPPGIDKTSPNLAVWLGAGQLGTPANDPAPDAIGVIR